MFILFSLSSTWKLRFRRFSSISLPFVVEPYLDGCPVKVVQFGKFFNNSVRWILAVFVHGLKVLDSFQFVQKIPVTHHLLKAFFYSMTKFFQKSMATGTGWRWGAPNVNFRKISVQKTIWDSDLLDLFRNICCKHLLWSPRERKEWKNRTYETVTCRKYDNSGSKTTLKRWRNRV